MEGKAAQIQEKKQEGRATLTTELPLRKKFRLHCSARRQPKSRSHTGEKGKARGDKKNRRKY